MLRTVNLSSPDCSRILPRALSGWFSSSESPCARGKRTHRRLTLPVVSLAAICLSAALPPASFAAATPGAVPAPAAARVGIIAFSTGFVLPDPDLSVDAQIFTVRPDGTHERQLTHLTTGVAGAGSPSISPDGKRIAYISNQSGPFALWLMNIDGSNQHLLVTKPGVDFFMPAWSPDGGHLVAVACQTLGFANWCDIDIMRSNGSGVRVLVGGHRHHASPTFSPDGRSVAFDSDRAGLKSAVWRVDLATGHLTRLTRPTLEAFRPAYAPSGRRMVVTVNCCQLTNQLYAARANGSNPQPLLVVPEPHFAAIASYSPDGRSLVFISDIDRDPGSGQDLFTMRADGSHVQAVVTDQPNVVISSWGVSAAPRGATR